MSMTQKDAEREEKLRTLRLALYSLGLELKPSISWATQAEILLSGFIPPDCLQTRAVLPERSAARVQISATQPESPRCAILRDASALTSGDRDRAYGNPATNLSCAQELYEVYRRYAKARPSIEGFGPAHEQAISQICTKLGRIATGGEYRRDNYVDGACYFAIAGEVAVRPMSGDVSLEAAKGPARHGS